MVYRIYVEKKPGFDGEAQGLKHELVELVGIKGLKALRLLNRYDVEGIDRDLFEKAIPTVFSEPPVDVTYTELPTAKTVFAVEYLPGQFDQRADSASECIQLLSQGERPSVRSARIYLLDGELSAEDLEAIKKYVINPVEAREASLDTRDTLKMEFAVPTAVETLNGFCALDDAALENFRNEKGLAMDHADIVFCQNYFKSEQRDPTITEIRLIDTYWSDHCRHTTFGTILNDVKIDDEVVQAAFDRYMALRAETGRDKKNRTLMDLATIGAKALKQRGILQNLDESEEINACTVKIKCDVDGELQDWLFLFKNETHNHPTEIEPFGGAATCIGGAIRDPLSGRSYVYQAMRVTGAGDPLKPVAETMPGKLPQRKLVTTAAAGYSSYGNQIGLATGQVAELYHPGYVAKRMEIGAVVGATPASHVRREEPQPGDVIILLGGRTGRDGIGGATGSSKAHKLTSLETCGAEVQKGNAPIERKLQRLFRRAGGDPHILVLKNLTPADVAASCEALVKEIDQSQILMLPGGFSGGDEPDGSAKFIAAFFRNPAVADAVNRLLNQRDGLALGICNGFQALIKLGLVPYGEIRPITENDPTLTFNTIHRHQSMLVRTRVASNKSPWLSECNVDDEHLIAISHGEGRFVCNDGLLQQLINNGQVATQYVDLNCVPTMDMRYNPNGSVLAIEGITSPDGRVFGKMGHSERSGDSLYKNVTGDKYQPIFEGGVNYFKL